MAPISDIIYRLRAVLLLPGALWSLIHDFGITELLDVVVDECWQIRSKRSGRCPRLMLVTGVQDLKRSVMKISRQNASKERHKQAVDSNNREPRPSINADATRHQPAKRMV